MNEKTYSISNYLGKFNAALGRTTQSIEEMGKIYVDAIAHYPSTARKEFAKKFPQVRACTWEAFEKIGNGTLNPKAFFLRVAVRNEIASLPIETQNSIFKGDMPSFKVVNPKNLRATTVSVAELDLPQSRILFDKEDGRVRSVGEQKTLIRNMPKPTVRERKTVKYAIVGERVVIEGVKFTLDELDEMRSKLYEAIFG